MLPDEFRKIKSGSGKSLEHLMESYLRQTWFICWHTTKDSRTAVLLLQKAWSNAIRKTSELKEPPADSFLVLVCGEILSLSQNETEPDEYFAAVERPNINKKFRLIENAADELDSQNRRFWLANIFGGLSEKRMAQITGKDISQVCKLIRESESSITSKIKADKTATGAQLVKLETELKQCGDESLSDMTLSDFLVSSLLHFLSKQSENENSVKVKRKDIKAMTQSVRKKKSNKKNIAVAIVIVLLIAAVIVFLILFLKNRNTTTSTRVTTYTASKVTYGDVNSTLSSSGTLSAVKTKTFSMSYKTTIKSLDVAAGDEVSKGDVIATVKGTKPVTQTVSGDMQGKNSSAATTTTTTGKTVTTELTAPYDGIILEVPVSKGDSVDADGEIAVLMSKDGFAMTLSVDESDLSLVKADQEVTVTVDATKKDYTGKVTAISYNGKTSGSSVTYSVTAKIDYADGLYPGMSADAEIVTESSGKGLLVPVDAVNTSGDSSYVYLAPSGAKSGKEYAEADIDTSSLTKVTVTTGMSDGTNIMVTGDGLSKGDLVLITKVTSTATGSDSSSSDKSFGGKGMGGMGSGGSFDPTQMGDKGGNGGQMPNGQAPTGNQQQASN